MMLTIMKFPILIAALMLTTAPFALAKNDAAAQQLLDAALQQEHFLQSDSTPYALDAEIKYQVNGPVQGHLRLRWQSKDHWRSRTELGPFQQIQIRNGEMEYTLSNADFTPIRVRDSFGLLNLEEDRSQLKAQKQRTRNEKGVAI